MSLEVIRKLIHTGFDKLGLTANRNRLTSDGPKPQRGDPIIFGQGLSAAQQAHFIDLEKELNPRNIVD